MEWDPSASELVVKVAAPVAFKLTGAPSTLAPSLNVTAPVGTPAVWFAGATVAVSVTELPKSCVALLDASATEAPSWLNNETDRAAECGCSRSNPAV